MAQCIDEVIFTNVEARMDSDLNQIAPWVTQTAIYTPDANPGTVFFHILLASRGRRLVGGTAVTLPIFQQRVIHPTHGFPMSSRLSQKGRLIHPRRHNHTRVDRLRDITPRVALRNPHWRTWAIR